MALLSEFRPGARVEVVAVAGEAGLVQRLYEFGLMEGEEIEVVALAPLGDPIEIRLGNTRLSLRKNEAAGVTVRDLAS
jgi:ferrous iron transport protein A